MVDGYCFDSCLCFNTAKEALRWLESEHDLRPLTPQQVKQEESGIIEWFLASDRSGSYPNTDDAEVLNWNRQDGWIRKNNFRNIIK